jgi:hypothetical protein
MQPRWCSAGSRIAEQSDRPRSHHQLALLCPALPCRARSKTPLQKKDRTGQGTSNSNPKETSFCTYGALNFDRYGRQERSHFCAQTQTPTQTRAESIQDNHVHTVQAGPVSWSTTLKVL